jgi:PRC-barrel domain
MADTQTEAQDLVGRKVVDPHGDKVGTIDALLIHGDEDRANWALVKLDLIGSRARFVPLHQAQQDEDDVRIVYEREWVKSAPKIEHEGDRLDDEEADKLRRHYGMERTTAPTLDDDDEIELTRETREAKPPAMDQGAFPKPPIPGIPDDEQPSPVKERDEEDAKAPDQAP